MLHGRSLAAGGWRRRLAPAGRGGVCYSAAMRGCLRAFIVVGVSVTVGCASVSTMTIPRCVDKVEVDGESRRQGDTLVFDHSFDAPWTFTEVVINNEGDARSVRLANNRPDGVRLVGGMLLAAVSGTVATASFIDMSDGRVADHGPIYRAIFGSIGFGLGGFLALTGWGPSHEVNLEQALCNEPSP